MNALISGISGQDGSYLADFLLAKGYDVHGIVRRSPTENMERIEHLRGQITLHQCDMLCNDALCEIVDKVRPTEVYNLAAQTFVAQSWLQPECTGNITGLGVLRLLEAVRKCGRGAKFYQASSSEMFGKVQESPQRESTPFYPRSPYGCAKVYAHWITVNYRESYGMFCCCGILFNHESPRRGKEFVTRKITTAVNRILNDPAPLMLGDITVKRDWGYAGDYVEAMWLMLQQDEPEDFVVATGESHTVAEFCEAAFKCRGMDYRDHVRISPELLRPADVGHLCGDSSKFREKTGWKPRVDFNQLVQMMVDADSCRVDIMELDAV
jgi:GDPmannose 4,6-dehydratase